MPRKPIISMDVVNAILTYKENGLSDKDICDMVGIDTSTFYRWLKEAETGIDGNNSTRPAQDLELKKELNDGLKKARAAFKAFHIQNITKASNLEIKVELVKGLKKARSAFKAYHLQNINTAARKEWTASAWILERMYPKEFSRIDRQVALMADAKKDNGMLDEILDYLGMVENSNVHSD